MAEEKETGQPKEAQSKEAQPKESANKTSDILLDILSKIKLVEKKQTLLSFQFNLLINRLNVITNKLESQVVEQDGSSQNGSVLEVNQESENVVFSGPAVKATSTEEPPLPQNNAKEQVNEDEPEEEIDFKFKTKIISHPREDDSKEEKQLEIKTEVPVRNLPVTQCVVYNKSPIENAKVIITDTNEQAVKATLTNNKGRWQVVLPAGTYIANVKWETQTEIIQFSQMFEISNSNSSIISLQMPKAVRKTKK